jgi:ribose 5-phosphate isomerase B
MRKIYFASDHAGFALKADLLAYVETLGYEAVDMGAKEVVADDDYPDFVTPCAKKAVEDAAMGVVIGGSGQGEAMCANRVQGARAAVFYGPMRALGALDAENRASEDVYDIVRLARLHNDANILSIGARFVSADDAHFALRYFLETPFSEDPRHVRRIGKFS